MVGFLGAAAGIHPRGNLTILKGYERRVAGMLKRKAGLSRKQMREDKEAVERRKSIAMRYTVSPDMPLYAKIWMTLDDPTFSDLALHYSRFSFWIIVFSVTAFCFESDMNCETIQQGIDGNFTFHEAFVTSENCRAWEGLWRVVEVGSIIVFTAELVLRGTTVPDRREASSKARTLDRPEDDVPQHCAGGDS